MNLHLYPEERNKSLRHSVTARLALLVIVCLFLPAMMAAAAEDGITVTRTVHLSAEMLKLNEIPLISLSSTPDADDGALKAVLRLGQSGWFPAWYIFIESETDLISNGGELRIGPVSIATDATYRVSLSYDRATGTVAFVITDADVGKTLERGIWTIERSETAFWAAEAIGGESISVSPGYSPVAAAWDLVMRDESGILLPMRMIDRSQPMFIRATVGAVQDGELWLVVSGDDRTVATALGTATRDEALYPLQTQDLPVGPVTVSLEYRVSGETVWAGEDRPLTVGRVEGAIVEVRTNPEAETLDITVSVASDGPIPDTHVYLDATAKGLLWDETTRRFVESVYATHRFDLTAMGLDADGSRKVRVPIDKGPELWRVELDLETEPDLIVQFVKTGATFGAWSSDVILSGSTTKPIETSPLELRREWEEAIAAIEARNAGFDASRGSVVFVGSSSIRIWETLEEDFPGLPVVNAGFGGSRINEATQYVDRIVVPFNPHTVVVYSGSNDISGGFSPEWVLADYVELVKAIHAKLPEARIIFISIAPSPARWSQHPRVVQANRLIKLYTETDERLEFVDVYSLMLGEDGLPMPHLYRTDGVHMTPEGYVIWTEVLRPYLGLE